MSETSLTAFPEISDNLNGLLLTLASSLACILGSLVICTDVIWRWISPSSKFDLDNNHAFLTCSLALSSGVLIYTSMYKLLPEGLAYYGKTDLVGRSASNSQALLVATYLLGIAICAAISVIIFHFTPKSVVQCAHDDNHDHGHSHGATHSNIGDEDLESIPSSSNSILEVNRVDEEQGVKSASRSYRSPRDADVEAQHFSTDPTESLSPDSCEHINISEESMLLRGTKSHPNYKSVDDKAPTHSTTSTQSHLFAIGLQTAIAISVHKVPEGFLTFATARANRELGFSVFIALAIHNISEGFTIAFPLFLALGSRGIAILAAFVLGGLSQPFGALLAWGMFKTGIIPSDGASMLESRTQLVFGLIVCTTAGFLSFIGFQMYGTASALGGRQNVILLCAFIGIAIVGLGGSLTAHD